MFCFSFKFHISINPSSGVDCWVTVGLVFGSDGKTLKNASASAGLEAKCTRLRTRLTHF